MVSCSHPKSHTSFSSLEEEFVYTSLAFSPVNATAQGLHKYKGVDLDTQLDDYSRRSIDRQRNFYSDFQKRLKDIDAGGLAAEDRADLKIMREQISLAFIALDIERNWARNPTVYVETVGNALFNPYVLNYAPKPERMRDIVARLNRVPAFLDQPKRFLFNSPPVWIKVAREENEGNINLIDKVIRPEVSADLKSEYDRAASLALDALRGFDRFLTDDLPKRSRGEPTWRLGEDHYNTKFKFALGTDKTPGEVLAAAESDLKTVRSRMFELAAPLHAKMYPDHTDREDQVISEVLARIADRHSAPAGYIGDAKADLAEAENFVRDKHLLTLPTRGNLQVIETPEFLRGIYSVGGFNPAPALEPQLGAFYWVTPIPKDWPKERAESKLREYNFFKLKLLTIHEAMPGHYVQGEFANDVQPKIRRILRTVYGNTPYVEGWAQFATQTMLDQGFLNNSPELRLTFQKEELRVLANAIIDIRLQTGKMTDQEAIDLMEKQTFQEREEAVGKLQRAQLSSCQLPSYFVGWRDWVALRDKYRKAKGAAFNVLEFNDAALKEGAVPLPVLARLLKLE
ncbi:MAG: DUF885 domain-containing protein [Acidobacteriota bacterium]|nr:DUF885 domain-containing protein [Acidobacteriota bacterium]